MKWNSKSFGAASIATLLLFGGLIASYGTDIPLNSLIVTVAVAACVWAFALPALRSESMRSPQRE